MWELCELMQKKGSISACLLLNCLDCCWNVYFDSSFLWTAPSNRWKKIRTCQACPAALDKGVCCLPLVYCSAVNSVGIKWPIIKINGGSSHLLVLFQSDLLQTQQEQKRSSLVYKAKAAFTSGRLDASLVTIKA